MASIDAVGFRTGEAPRGAGWEACSASLGFRLGPRARYVAETARPLAREPVAQRDRSGAGFYTAAATVNATFHHERPAMLTTTSDSASTNRSSERTVNVDCTVALRAERP